MAPDTTGTTVDVGGAMDGRRAGVRKLSVVAAAEQDDVRPSVFTGVIVGFGIRGRGTVDFFVLLPAFCWVSACGIVSMIVPSGVIVAITVCGRLGTDARGPADVATPVDTTAD